MSSLILIFSLILSGQTSFNYKNSAHYRDMEKHKNDLPAKRIYPPNLKAGTPRALQKIVYGYLPYWITDTSSFRWNDITHLGVFCVVIDVSGGVLSFSDKHGWPETALVQTAHNAGVWVELVFTLFGSTDIDTFVKHADLDNFIELMIDEMEVGNADGINIDFEFVPESARNEFTSFLQNLRNRLNTRGHTSATISFAGPTSIAAGLDFPAIFNILDYYFIMAYGYHWSGSSYAGPVGQYRTDETWSSYGSLSLLRTIASISKAVGADNRHKIIAGLPYYGREWITNANTWPTAAATHIGSVTYIAARSLMNEGKVRQWDDGICNPVLIWAENTTYHQVWYDDEESLACKYHLANQQDIGGVGYWALGYDNGYSELWDVIETHFNNPYDNGLGSRDNPIEIPSFPYADSKNTEDGSRYFNYYSCNDALAEYGREFVYSFVTCKSGTLDATVDSDPTDDPDIHILSEPLESACIDRGHLTTSTYLQPGRYYVVIDTYVDSSVELEGPYTLTMDFIPDAGETDCPVGTACVEGTCSECPYLSQRKCEGVCIDVLSDDDNCGDCGNICEYFETCQNGICNGNIVNPDCDEDADDDNDYISNGDEGCLYNLDFDNDGTYDYEDIDSDNDGLPDAIEAGDTDLNTPPRDTDSDGAADYVDTDSDNDTLHDGVEDINHDGKLGDCIIECVYGSSIETEQCGVGQKCLLNNLCDPSMNETCLNGETDPLTPDTDGDGVTDDEDNINETEQIEDCVTTYDCVCKSTGQNEKIPMPKVLLVLLVLVFIRRFR
jgi:Glycosyl hydrolases family 18/Stigma-specific protein, Stig1